MPIVLGLSQGAALRLVDPTTSCWTFSPWFRLDRLAELAGRLNQLWKEQSRLSRAATKEQPESKPPGISSYPHPR